MICIHIKNKNHLHKAGVPKMKPRVWFWPMKPCHPDLGATPRLELTPTLTSQPCAQDPGHGLHVVPTLEPRLRHTVLVPASLGSHWMLPSPPTLARLGYMLQRCCLQCGPWSSQNSHCVGWILHEVGKQRHSWVWSGLWTGLTPLIQSVHINLKPLLQGNAACIWSSFIREQYFFLFSLLAYLLRTCACNSLVFRLWPLHKTKIRPVNTQYLKLWWSWRLGVEEVAWFIVPIM